jgi:hypothetical protein
MTQFMRIYIVSVDTSVKEVTSIGIMSMSITLLGLDKFNSGTSPIVSFYRILDSPEWNGSPLFFQDKRQNC